MKQRLFSLGTFHLDDVRERLIFLDTVTIVYI